MRKRWLAYAVLWLLFYVVFLISTIPAPWVSWSISRVTEGRINLSEPSGSLWHGKAELFVVYSRASPLAVGETAWHVNPLCLLSARLCVELSTSGSAIRLRGVFGLSPWEFELRDVSANFPADVAGKLFPGVGVFSPKGQIHFNTGTLRIERNGMYGTADIQWREAGSELSSVQPLGDYRLDIRGEGKIAHLKLATLHGDLLLNGQGRWEIGNDGKFQFVGNAKPRARRLDLEPLLMLLGRDQGGGQRPLILNGRLRFAVLPAM